MMTTLTLAGLRPEASQVWGNVRLVPLIRDTIRDDLRMGLRAYDNPFQPVLVDGTPQKPKAAYTSFIPHGLVLAWGQDGEPVTPVESWFLSRSEKKMPDRKMHGLYRMVRKEDVRRVRMLPMHLALDSLLALHFGGPTLASRFWSKAPLRVRAERGLIGWGLPDLEPALKIFEIHRHQCGVLLFVDDAFASAFVVGHPDDYRQVHHALVCDLYGEALWHHGLARRDVPMFDVSLDDDHIDSLDALEAAVADAREAWADFAVDVMASSLLGRAVTMLHDRKLGPFRLGTFLTGSDPNAEQHLGEALVDQGGNLQYLKSFGLSRTTLRRVLLLETLAAHAWCPSATAEAMRLTVPQLRRRLVADGFADWVQ